MKKGNLIETKADLLRRAEEWRGSGERELEITIPETDPALTRALLATAGALGRDLGARITVLSIRIQPFPAPLAHSPAVEHLFKNRLLTLAAETGVSLRGSLVFARDLPTGLGHGLARNSLVLIGTPRRWWPTREERLARLLASAGHSVALVRV